MQMNLRFFMMVINLAFLWYNHIARQKYTDFLIDILDNVGKEEVWSHENICKLFDSKLMHREITKTMKWLKASKAYSTRQILAKCLHPENRRCKPN
jgi:hypothetical protein